MHRRHLHAAAAACFALLAACTTAGLVFMSTPYNEEDIDFLVKIGTPALKLASIHAAEPSLLRAAAQTPEDSGYVHISPAVGVHYGTPLNTKAPQRIPGGSSSGAAPWGAALRGITGKNVTPGGPGQVLDVAAVQADGGAGPELVHAGGGSARRHAA